MKSKIEYSIILFLEKHKINLNEKLLISFSGGIDSLALLTAVSHLGLNSSAIYINHHVREEDELKAEIELNKINAKKLNIPLFIKDLDIDDINMLKKKEGLEGALRTLRYEKLCEFAKQNNIKYILTAHNSDDNVEQAIMNFFRSRTNSNKIKEINKINDVYILRPLLNISHKTLENYIKENNLSHSDDSTNTDMSNLRSKIRLNLLPAVEKVFPSFKKTIIEKEESNSLKDFDNEDVLYYHILNDLGASNSNNNRIKRKDINNIIEFSHDGNNSGKLQYNDISIIRCKKNLFFLKKANKHPPVKMKITKSGQYSCPYFSLSVFCVDKEEIDNNHIPFKNLSNNIALIPDGNIIVRTLEQTDEMLIKILKKKSISTSLFKYIPVILRNNKIIAMMESIIDDGENHFFEVDDKNFDHYKILIFKYNL